LIITMIVHFYLINVLDMNVGIVTKVQSILNLDENMRNMSDKTSAAYMADYNAKLALDTKY